MDALSAIFNRRSIRKYTSQEVSEEQINTILSSGMHAPSAVNKQPWHFIVFRDRETMRRINEFHTSSSMLLNANVAILVCWDENLQHDVGYGPVDCAAATQNMLLAIHSMGLGGVWVGIYPREQRINAVQELFKLPRNIKGFSIISIGYPAESKNSPNRFNSDRVHAEKW